VKEVDSLSRWGLGDYPTPNVAWEYSENPQ